MRTSRKSNAGMILERSCAAIAAIDNALLYISIRKYTMKPNMSHADQIIRRMIAILVGVLYLTDLLIGWFGGMVLIAALVSLVSSFGTFCPIYALLGLSSRFNDGLSQESGNVAP
jgi:hypothetical protein